jgi:hypothetical protein
MTIRTFALGAALWQNANSLCAPPKSTAEMIEREPVTLESLARQLDQMLAELSSLRDDVNVLMAIVQPLHNSHTRLLSEIRATHRSRATASGCAASKTWRQPTPTNPRN